MRACSWEVCRNISRASCRARLSAWRWHGIVWHKLGVRVRPRKEIVPKSTTKRLQYDIRHGQSRRSRLKRRGHRWLGPRHHRLLEWRGTDGSDVRKKYRRLGWRSICTYVKDSNEDLKSFEGGISGTQNYVNTCYSMHIYANFSTHVNMRGQFRYISILAIMALLATFVSQYLVKVIGASSSVRQHCTHLYLTHALSVHWNMDHGCSCVANQSPTLCKVCCNFDLWLCAVPNDS